MKGSFSYDCGVSSNDAVRPISACHWTKPDTDPHLEPDALHIWRISLDQPAAELAQLQALLAPDEVQRAASYRHLPARRQFVTCRGALRLLLARYLAVVPAAIQFRYTPHGKPLLNEQLTSAPLQFNVSHTAEMGLIGIAQQRALGVDIERCRPLSDLDGLAGRYFALSEQQVLARLAEADRRQQFFRIWTQKEAVLKACGMGLSLGPERIAIGLEREPPGVRFLSEAADDQPPWFVHEFQPAPGYVGAVAVPGRPVQLSYFDWQLDDQPDRERP